KRTNVCHQDSSSGPGCTDTKTTPFLTLVLQVLSSGQRVGSKRSITIEFHSHVIMLDYVTFSNPVSLEPRTVPPLPNG
ncbi:unnamed protein product, partial [Gulo gulo]